MRVAVIGDGGREQALAWACERSGHVVEIAPSLDHLTVLPVDLVIPGPEAALAGGIANECAERGIPCFGPTGDLARVESSKGYARDLAAALGIPGPAYARFTGPDEVDEAIAWQREVGRVAVKLDGLAGGKGVTVPANAAEAEAAIRALDGPFVLEERLVGSECTLLALCDGHTARALPLAQDHKPIGEGDTGPNTGGMGAYAPAPVADDVDELVATFVDPVLRHFADAGTPYVGVLYAGLMLTADGARLIEYNCRFGDPEAQTVLPLLSSDLAELALAATKGKLHTVPFEVRDAAACTVIAAAGGYPSSPVTGTPITIDTDALASLEDVAVFPAGMKDGVTTGGRVVAVTGFGDDLRRARANAYEGMSHISFDGMQVRRDIGWRAPGALLSSYADAGVDIDEGSRAVSRMRSAVERTHGPAVLGGLGSFGGVFSAKALTAMSEPVLVASADGVGTKVELAARAGRVRGVGHDIVNHCVNDVLVQAARPLFFLDYIAASRLDADMVAEIVEGIAEACEGAGCALLGGETAEMPGVYQPGAFDIAGTLIGAAEASALLPRPGVGAGDVLIGLASSGPHTNGYSLLRTVFEWLPLDAQPMGVDRPIGDMLLEPHRNYLPVLDPALATGAVKALAHITGGGLPENLPRVLPSGVAAEVELGSWPSLPLFDLVSELATGIDVDELHRTLNMGIGMVVVCAPDDVDALQRAIDEPTYVIGHLVDHDSSGPRVRLR